jgi:hypothetical protein
MATQFTIFSTEQDDDAKKQADNAFSRMRDVLATKGRELYRLPSPSYEMGRVDVDPVLYLYGGFDKDDNITVAVEERHNTIAPELMQRMLYHSKPTKKIGRVFYVYRNGNLVSDHEESLRILSELSSVALPTYDTWTRRSLTEVEERIGSVLNDTYNVIVGDMVGNGERFPWEAVPKDGGQPTESDNYIAACEMVDFLKDSRDEFGMLPFPERGMLARAMKWKRTIKPEGRSQGEFYKGTERFIRTFNRLANERRE